MTMHCSRGNDARRWGLATLSGAAVLGTLATGSQAQVRTQSCVDPVLKAEQDHDIPPGLLLAMALVESGTNGEPNALALNVNGRQVTAHNETEAVSRLRASTTKGNQRTNATVGCMQLSVGHHLRRFSTLESMIDPARNATYGAGYLRQHHDELGSWSAAVQRFQGGSARQRIAYQCRVHSALVGLDPVSAKLIEDPRCRSLQTTPVRVAERVQMLFLEDVPAAVAAVP